MPNEEPKKLSRRDFLSLGAASMAALSLPASLIAASESELVQEALAELNDDLVEEEILFFSGEAGQCSGMDAHGWAYDGDGFEETELL